MVGCCGGVQRNGPVDGSCGGDWQSDPAKVFCLVHERQSVHSSSRPSLTESKILGIDVYNYIKV